ncbi:glycosyltransferase family 4 protein [Microbacterium cremeum]|uniref:glycosyltransferase family 4 protein n=1 Tax=Microbacterium cremeum TaxID=2782169 RepID=UPI001887BA5A|nr:glycosyltransferase family 4 protein [Microbacterium cremeum]
MTTTLTPARAAAWHRVHWKHVVVVVYGDPVGDIGPWIRRTADVLHADFLLAPGIASSTHGLGAERVSVADGTGASPVIDLASILDWMHRLRRRWDVVLIDAGHPLPEPESVARLQHAAHEFHADGEIGIVTPAYAGPDGTAAGYQFDRQTGEFVPALPGSRDYGQVRMPRYVLGAAAHGLYVTSVAIDRIDIAARNLNGLDLDLQAGRLVRHAWAGNIRTLCFSSTVVSVSELPVVRARGEQRRWQLERRVGARGKPPRIIFVLQATTISGGIRAVFEIANGLSARGFDVSVWSLQGPPTWFELRVPVVTYRNFDDLILSLRNEDAIKVATWWETAEVVWLASVNHGMPVYLIQEFETWFYPDDAVARAAVVASYRREFASLTEARFQQGELAEVGVRATLIPHGYDSDTFRVLPGHSRDENTLLALGRSFFQKNFAMTERAWRSLGRERPKLQLFGTEPDILVDERVDYRIRPLDAEVNELYNTATVFVQTSRHEGFCLPVLEAMAAGCPVITTDSDGNMDFCRDGENCVIVPQDDDAALAAAIRRLMGDPQERRRLSEAGLETASRYRWPVVLDSVAAYYEHVANAVSAGEPLAKPAEERVER